MSKQDATRTIRLTSLPPTLNLQLLRFVYDRQKGCKKKLNQYVGFSETIEISNNYLENGREKNTTYNLCAVLVHVGPSAHSGHYIAHIKDPKSGIWYKFNDEKVVKIEALTLGQDELVDDGANVIEDANADAEAKPPQNLSKGQHASKDAYMLVYKQQSSQSKWLSVGIPVLCDMASSAQIRSTGWMRRNGSLCCQQTSLSQLQLLKANSNLGLTRYVKLK